MMNGSMYDAFQAIDRTHTPLLYNTLTPGASREAAAAQAAYEIILDCYPLRHDVLDPALTGPSGTLTLIPDSPAKTAGVALGHAIAQQYMAARLNDGANASMNYTPSSDPGKWRPGPLQPNSGCVGPSIWGRPHICRS